MPNRILRSGFLDSETVDALAAPPNAETFYLRLMLVVDDWGRSTGNVRALISSTYKLRSHVIKDRDAEGWVAQLETAGLVRRYQVGGKPYIELLNFNQRKWCKSSAFPEPPQRHSDITVEPRGSTVEPRANSASVEVLVVGSGGVGSGGELPSSAPKSERTARAPSPESLDLANELHNAVLRHKPDHALREQFSDARRQAWAREIDLMLRRDGRTVDAVHEVLRWLPTAPRRNGFCWSDQVQSAEALRRQFDRLEQEMRNGTAQDPQVGSMQPGSRPTVTRRVSLFPAKEGT